MTFVQGVLTETLRDPTNTDVITFLTTYLGPPAFEGDLDAKDPADRKAHEEALLAPIGMNGQRVKSYGEYLIATFLYKHQVPFEYERQYPHSTGRHRPDFTLSPARGPHPISFIEYFGTDRSGRTRADIDRARYLGSRQWKEAEHARFGTQLLALHYFDLAERGVDGFNALLGEMLRGAGYALTPLPHDELVRELESTRIRVLVALLVSFLRLCKGSALSLEQLQAVADAQLGRRADRDRAHFVRAFQNADARATIFAVGDDFQSIYRFAGGTRRCVGAFRCETGLMEHSMGARTFRTACTSSRRPHGRRTKASAPPGARPPHRSRPRLLRPIAHAAAPQRIDVGGGHWVTVAGPETAIFDSTTRRLLDNRSAAR